MKDIDQLIEQIHAENRKRLEQECLLQGEKELRQKQESLPQSERNPQLSEQKSKPEVGRHIWRYAAAVAIVVGVAAILLLPLRQERQKSHLAKADVTRTARQMPHLAYADVPQPVRQQLEETKQTDAPLQPKTPKVGYAYSETDDGVRVYCDDGCNADEVLERMQRVMETLEEGEIGN